MIKGFYNVTSEMIGTDVTEEEVQRYAEILREELGDVMAVHVNLPQYTPGPNGNHSEIKDQIEADEHRSWERFELEMGHKNNPSY